MDKAAVLKILSHFRRLVEARGIRVDRLVLYGSYASGTWREGSDIDVVVISDDFAPMSYWQRTEFLAGVIYELYEPVEAVAMTTGEWSHGRSRVVEYASLGEVVGA